MELEVHEAALVFPMMEGEEFESLVANIREQGLIEPIDLYEERVLDGRNRLLACERAGVEPQFREANLNGASPLEFVIAKNLHRRHLTPAQRAALALELLPQFQAEARLRKIKSGELYGRGHPREVSPKTGEPLSKGDSRKAAEQAAKAVSVGRSAVEAAVAIQKRDPKVIDKMKKGELNVSQAARAVGLVGRGYSNNVTDRTSVADHRLDSQGRSQPTVFYGKGDKWRESLGPIIRYLSSWERRGYEFRHVPPKEAARRIKQIDEIKEKLEAVRADLEQRSHSASLSMRKE